MRASFACFDLRRTALVIGLAFFACLGPALDANAQIKPRILIAFDTSASMGQAPDGTLTYGDGVGATNCIKGLDVDCDGLPNDSRMFVAKEAVRNAVLAYGDVEWALSRFHQTQGTNITCNTFDTWECMAIATSFGNPQCYTGADVTAGNCSYVATDIGNIPAACRPGAGANPALNLVGGGDPINCINYSGQCGPGAGIGDVLVGFPGLGSFATKRNETAILKWMDNAETNPVLGGTTSGNYCSHATAGDCELRATGCTPLAGILTDSGTYLATVKSGDTKAACRPYSVLLITDGNQNGFTGDPIVVAGDLNDDDVLTYVVGLGISGAEKTQLNNIASAGGTDAGATGGDKAYFVNDPDTFASGLAEVVRRSLLIETCDGDDNDCDSNVDEGFPLFCDKGNAHAAADLCDDPGETTCDGIDDNCDGNVDEGLLNRCGTCGVEPVEICDGLDNDCDGPADEGNVCSCFGMSEICDGEDNDCDNVPDNGVTRPCSTDVGKCTVGLETCSVGNWGTCTGTLPVAETCNNQDDNCDGVVDLLTRDCGQTKGVCQKGKQLCTGGTWGVCVGQVLGDDEICDGLDNDCDGTADDGNPGGGAACGMAGCAIGTFQCKNGSLKCVSTTSGGDELCNGEDDDCDGTIDEGLNVGGACGESGGDCAPGQWACVDDLPVCVGAFGGTDEECDGLDNDCDGVADNDVAVGGVCGSDTGECEEGNLGCIEGGTTCVGEKPAGRETCDCDDNDCDGETDEAPDTGTLCPSGSECKNCQCALPCVENEFGFACPSGKDVQMFGNDCFCVADLCSDAKCAKETVEVDGEVRCAPDDADLSTCVCKSNACTFPCEGVVCQNGLVCNPRDTEGRCEENSCRGLGCPVGKVCNGASGECEDDLCNDVECGDQACRRGVCEPSCVGIECADGEACHAGECVDDKCDSLKCPNGKVCDPDSGECVPNLCQVVRCPFEAVCDVVSGSCEVDPCTYLHCPGQQTCDDGECTLDETGGDGGIDGGTNPRYAPGRRILAAGRGFFCAASTTPNDGGLGPLVFFAVCLLVASRRRRALASVIVVAGSIALGSTLSACNVDPYCINCTSDGAIVVDGSVVPDGGLLPDSGPQADAAIPDAALPPDTEGCNGKDDDDDGNVDEDFDLKTDVRHCGSCETKCAPAHAFPQCETGACTIASCDVGWHDIDGKASNGCEYRCLPNAEDDGVCDQYDNDCDKKIDEDVDFDDDVNNCGQCGRTCNFAHASSTCEDGDCVLGPCATNFYDIDLKKATGCEYPCTNEGAELCNLDDEDCDGVIDEGNPGGGAVCGETEGACEAGELACLGGALVCSGGMGRTFESCDGDDNDCDTHIDEDTHFDTDINNCGECGTVCDPDFGIGACQSGDCVILACESGHYNLNTLVGDGCEYACNFRGPEICNGVDDDCDKQTDESTSAPANYCNPNGECAGTIPTCDGVMGWVCHYNDPDYENVETTCDTKDNDCDAQEDEGFAVGDECSNGESGICFRGGVFGCNGPGDGVTCSAPAVGGGSPETCDGTDEDCDGTVDEDMDTDTVPAVPVDVGGGTVYVMQWEASRPDATTGNAGTISTHACSRENVLPWTQVTWQEASDACCALNDGGTCSGEPEWRLCDAADWQTACEAQSGTCNWAYDATCSVSQPTVCNGAEYDCSGTAGDQDCLFTTGSPTFSNCDADWGAADEIFDLSGNVKEWTDTQRGSASIHEIRGGAYNNMEDGRSCSFEFTAGDSNFVFPNTGFRCCFYP